MRHYRETQRIKDLPKINLNKATFDELICLPGIGPITANRIVEYRRQNGRFRNTEDLIFKLGLRQRLLDQIGFRLEV